MLRKLDRGRSPRVWNIVTGDKTWVYQYDPETKQRSAAWVFPDENPHVKFKRNRRASKQMIACFFAKFGQVASITLEDKKMVTADWYVNQCLPKVFQAWRTRRSRMDVRGLLLHRLCVWARHSCDRRLHSCHCLCCVLVFSVVLDFSDFARMTVRNL